VATKSLSADIVALGFDPARLAAAENRAAQLTHLQSLLIFRNENNCLGALLPTEQIVRSHSISTSVSKSYLSALVGIALQEGYIESLDQTVYEILSGIFPAGMIRKGGSHPASFDNDPGLDWYELGPIAESWLTSRDWIKFFIDLPLARTPGNFFNYSTAGTHVLSAILTKAAGMSLMEFAENKLFRPGGMTILRWDRITKVITMADGVCISRFATWPSWEKSTLMEEHTAGSRSCQPTGCRNRQGTG